VGCGLWFVQCPSNNDARGLLLCFVVYCEFLLSLLVIYTMTLKNIYDLSYSLFSVSLVLNFIFISVNIFRRFLSTCSVVINGNI